jgi:hypothetical protein
MFLTGFSIVGSSFNPLTAKALRNGSFSGTDSSDFTAVVVVDVSKIC